MKSNVPSRRLLCSMLGIGSALVMACGDNLQSVSLFDEPLAELPQTMSELGLYPDPSDRRQVSEQVFSYRPLQELWSNGADKERYAFLPAPVDNSRRTEWRFADGTALFKTFAFEGRPIETRLLRLLDGRWEYSVYGWRADASDADLLAIDEPTSVPAQFDGEEFDHQIPSRLDCRTCHESQQVAVLGFDELGLGPQQLSDLRSEGLLSDPVVEPVEAIGGDGLEQQVKIYLEGNCTHCHNDFDGPSSSYDLSHEVALQALICQETDSSLTAAGLRVDPGSPDTSVLLLALMGDEGNPELKDMPPVGVQLRDQQGITLIGNWISELEGPCPE